MRRRTSLYQLVNPLTKVPKKAKMRKLWLGNNLRSTISKSFLKTKTRKKPRSAVVAMWFLKIHRSGWEPKLVESLKRRSWLRGKLLKKSKLRRELRPRKLPRSRPSKKRLLKRRRLLKNNKPRRRLKPKRLPRRILLYNKKIRSAISNKLLKTQRRSKMRKLIKTNFWYFSARLPSHSPSACSLIGYFWLTRILYNCNHLSCNKCLKNSQPSWNLLINFWQKLITKSL